MSDIEPLAKVNRRAPGGASPPAARGKPTVNSPPSPEVADKVSLSTAETRSTVTRGGGSEIRHDLVNKYRRALSKGSYEIKASEIAEKIVQIIRDEKDMLIF